MKYCKNCKFFEEDVGYSAARTDVRFICIHPDLKLSCVESRLHNEYYNRVHLNLSVAECNTFCCSEGFHYKSKSLFRTLWEFLTGADE